MFFPFTITIAAEGANPVGDTFSRLLESYFCSLGYENLHFNVHKSGREIDVDATHRTENRRLVAECKATDGAIGGSDINKFVGALDAERRSSKLETVGYFVSLSGFTETALEQERVIQPPRVLLITAKHIVSEMTERKMWIAPAAAAQAAAHLLSQRDLRPDIDCDLIGHRTGWIWVCYGLRGGSREAFVLVHTDGDVLDEKLARRVFEDIPQRSNLKKLELLFGPDVVEDCTISALAAYREYLRTECGVIQLEGLPADQEVGSREFQIESLFVPLKLEQLPHLNGESSGLDKQSKNAEDLIPVGKALQAFPRLALLGPPGIGKSTLLKRIAIAYSFPERRAGVDDGLPDRQWLPIFIRCRSLPQELSTNQLAEHLADKAELVEAERLAFLHAMRKAFKEGKAILLIDGLDEIADPGQRLKFASQLRVFLALYPQTAAIITSREAGFRVIGGTLSEHCDHFRIAELSDEDISRLTVAWHQLVVGNKAEVVADAIQLAEQITSNSRVRNLAVNPLLLTTLLLVKRWVGQLPTKRSVLYGKALEVLLMTWNVQAHEPLEADEVMPQLEYLAFEMMLQGVQSVSSKALTEILTRARTDMPEVLGHSKMTVSELVEKVELRSSILVQSGHVVEDGTLLPVYEFPHLTFQEYLAAKAIAENHLPGHLESSDLVTVLTPHLRKQSWREVVPLAAVLAGRRSQALVRYLISFSEQVPLIDESIDNEDENPATTLGRCLADEVQVAPDLLQEALRCVVRRSELRYVGEQIRSTKYKSAFIAVMIEEFPNDADRFLSVGSELGESILREHGWSPQNAGGLHTDELLNLFRSNRPNDRAAAALGTMELLYSREPGNRWDVDPTGFERFSKEMFQTLRDELLEVLRSATTEAEKFAVGWALAWYGDHDMWKNEVDAAARALFLLAAAWLSVPHEDSKHVLAWAVARLPVFPSETAKQLLNEAGITAARLEAEVSEFDRPRKTKSSLRFLVICGYYLGEPWSIAELKALTEAYAAEREDANLNDFPVLSLLLKARA